MAFDFNKLKQDYLARREEKQAAQEEKEKASKATKKPSALDKKLGPLKQGIADLKTVLEEGNYKLFIKQVAVILLATYGMWTLLGQVKVKKDKIEDQISALALQQTHQDDYKANKDRLLRLEPLFPDMSKKNEWLVQTLMKIFSSHQIQADINGNAVESDEGKYAVMSQEVTYRDSFANLGKFLEDMENGGDFLRISSLVITKLTDTASLGTAVINMRFNTVFPKEKFGRRLFKDYDQQMKQIQAEREADAAEIAEATATQAPETSASGEKANAA